MGAVKGALHIPRHVRHYLLFYYAVFRWPLPLVDGAAWMTNLLIDRVGGCWILVVTYDWACSQEVAGLQGFSFAARPAVLSLSAGICS